MADLQAKLGSEANSINRNFYVSPTPHMDEIYLTTTQYKTGHEPKLTKKQLNPQNLSDEELNYLSSSEDDSSMENKDPRPKQLPEDIEDSSETEDRLIIDDPNKTVLPAFDGLHKLIKTIAAKQAFRRRNKTKGKRGQYLPHLNETDKERTFLLNSKASKYRQHHIAAFYFQLRTHSLKTRERLHRHAHPPNKTKNPKLFHLFHQIIHPTDQCHAHLKERDKKESIHEDSLRQREAFCETINENEYNFKDPPAPTEDTIHAYSCALSGNREAIYRQTWNQIRTKVKEKITNNTKTKTYQKKAFRKKFNHFTPFIAATPTMLTQTLKPLPIHKSLTGLSDWPESARQVGLIPSCLVQALKECGVPWDDAGVLASEIVLMGQLAELEAWKERCKQLAEELNYKENYRILRKQLDDTEKEVPPDLMQREGLELENENRPTHTHSSC